MLTLLEAQGDIDKAIRYANRLLHEDPLSEGGYQCLMRLHTQRGDRAAALRVYHTCSTILQQELGVEPGPELQQAYASLLNLEATQAPALPVPTGAPRQARLIGRGAEWQALRTAWRSAASGRAHFFLIAGEAGIGKTRIVEELSTFSSDRGSTNKSIVSAWTRCYGATQRLAYAPVVEWLRSSALRAQTAALDDVWLRELARLLPEFLVGRTDLQQPEPLTERWQRRRLFEALARAFSLDEQPLLLAIDDVQWCDADTFEWLSYLFGTGASTSLLVVGTLRPEEVDDQHPLQSLLLQLRAADQVTEIELDALTIAETAALAAQTTGELLEEAHAQQLYHYTQGNPLFIVEAMRSGQDSPAFLTSDIASTNTSDSNVGVSLTDRRQDAIAAPLALEPGSQTAPLPSKMRGVLESRLAQLSQPAREFASLASAIGRGFTFALLLEASADTERDEDQVVRNLDELWQRRIVRRTGCVNGCTPARKGRYSVTRAR